MDATAEGKLRRGQTVEEVRRLVGKPDSTRSTIIGEKPIEIWIYQQTTQADKSRYVGLTVFSFGLGGFVPVGASEKHFIVFSDGKVVAWDIVPETISSEFAGQSAVGKKIDLASHVSVSPVLMPSRISSPVRRLAVVPLSDASGTEVPSYMDFVLNFVRQRQPGLMLVERDTIRPVFEEALIQHSGRIDDETTIRLGKMVGADSLLTYRIEPIDRTALRSIIKSGGAVVGSVEIRVIQIEKGLTLYRQLVTATTLLPEPGKGSVWPEEPVYRAYRVSVEHAASYGLSALVAAFGENPLGTVPTLNNKEALIVLGVLDGSPAQIAGIKAGDRIITMNGQPMRAWTDQVQLPVSLTIERQGKTQQVTVIPGS